MLGEPWDARAEPPIGANTPITLSLELGAHERPFGTASVPGGTDGGVDRADARPPFCDAEVSASKLSPAGQGAANPGQAAASES